MLKAFRANISKTAVNGMFTLSTAALKLSTDCVDELSAGASESAQQAQVRHRELSTRLQREKDALVRDRL